MEGKHLQFSVVSSPDEVRLLLGKVCEIADSNRSSFGFLPQSAYAELAARGQLWVAKTNLETLVGYVLFGSSRSRVRIFQLYVSETARGTGVGSHLISRLKLLATERGYQTLSARVAADLESNSFWEKQGFRIIRQVPGGQTTDRLINERLYEVVGTSLWEPSSDTYEASATLPSLERPILSSAVYAIDLNVLFDVTRDREHAALMRDVISNALSNEYRLCVTSEFAKELERTTDLSKEDPILQFAKGLPTLPEVPARLLEPNIPFLRNLIFPEEGRSPRRQANDQSDLLHLAICIHHKVSGFVTREAAILRRSQTLLEKFGIEVISPVDLSTGDANQDFATPYLFAEVEGRSFSVKALGEVERNAAEEFLARLGVGSVRARAILDSGTDKLSRTRVVFRSELDVFALATWGPVSRQTRQILLYVIVDESTPYSQKAVDHVLEAAAQFVPSSHMVQISLLTLGDQYLTRETASIRGFTITGETPDGDGFVTCTRFSYRSVITEGRWEQFARDIESVTGMRVSRRCPTYSELANTGLLFERQGTNERKLVPLFKVETAFSPLIIIGKGRVGVVAPIREDYANDLISAATRQFTLFPKEAPLHLERAYFGRPGLERAYTRGAVVIFYISGRRGEAVGFGRVTASGRCPVADAQANFARQGVLSGDELKEISVDDEVGFFTFDSYRNFERPISFLRLRERGVVNAANLVTSQQLTPDQLLAAIDLGQVH